MNRERAIFDKGNWRIVAQCETLDGKTLKVGVIKTDEFTAISRANLGEPIATNSFSFLLDCPT